MHICKCGREIIPQERASYGGQCEDCWVLTQPANCEPEDFGISLVWADVLVAA